MYRIVWQSKITDKKGYGVWLNEKEMFETLVETLNKKYPDIIHSIEQRKD